MELLQILPEGYVLFVTVLLGLILGSFLDVVVCRFHTGKSINGRSRCMSCGHTLSWYELFPLVSYIALRGKCKSCGGFIPLRLLAMEITTASLFVFVYLHSPSLILLAFGLFLICILLVTAVYDMHHMVIPHEFVYTILFCALAYIGYQAYLASTYELLIPHFIGACSASLFYLALWIVSKGRWIGFGDVKLAFPLALMLPLWGTFSFVVFSFWIGAGISITLLLLQKMVRGGQHHLLIPQFPLTMKSEVPFAPFMILAFVIVFFAQGDVLALMSSLF